MGQISYVYTMTLPLQKVHIDQKVHAHLRVYVFNLASSAQQIKKHSDQRKNPISIQIQITLLVLSNRF